MITKIKNIAFVAIIVSLLISVNSCQKSNVQDDNLVDVLKVEKSGVSTIIEPNLKILVCDTFVPTQTESDAYLFIVETEKLADDLYNTFFTLYGLPTFSIIASSESNHVDAMEYLLSLANISYSLPTDVGVFNNTVIQTLYNDLLAQGQISQIEALQVAAGVEERSIVGLTETLADSINPDAAIILENLLRASRNHLRSFVYQLNNAGVTYQPILLDISVYTEIITSTIEHGKQYHHSLGGNNLNTTGNGYHHGNSGNGNNGTCDSTNCGTYGQGGGSCINI